MPQEEMCPLMAEWMEAARELLQLSVRARGNQDKWDHAAFAADSLKSLYGNDITGPDIFYAVKTVAEQEGMK